MYPLDRRLGVPQSSSLHDSEDKTGVMGLINIFNEIMLSF